MGWVLFIISLFVIAYYKGLSDKDSFTGCYNKDWAIKRKNSKLVRMMKKAKLTSKKLGILYIDMDNFKEYNDSKGHILGDELILSTVKAIKDKLCRGDVVVRFGGDEVVIFVPNLTDDLEKLACIISDNVRIATSRAVSIGCYTFLPEYPINVNNAITNADKNMYVSKRSKVNKRQ